MEIARAYVSEAGALGRRLSEQRIEPITKIVNGMHAAVMPTLPSMHNRNEWSGEAFIR